MYFKNQTQVITEKSVQKHNGKFFQITSRQRHQWLARFLQITLKITQKELQDSFKLLQKWAQAKNKRKWMPDVLFKLCNSKIRQNKISAIF